MKVLKCFVPVLQDEAKTEYIWPDVWLLNKEAIPAIFVPPSRGDEQEIEGRGKVQPMFALVPDGIFDKIAEAMQGEEATREEFETYTDARWPVKTIITDDQAVLTVVSKQARGEALTQEEKNVIDPDHPEKGVSKTVRPIETVESQYAVTWKAS